MKRVFTFLIACCIGASMLTGCANNKKAQDNSEQQNNEVSKVENKDLFDGGSGSEEDPYKISSAESLLKLASSVNDGSQGGFANKYFLLTSDIDLADVDWTPIGNMNDKEKHSTFFLGSFDGDNHTILNLKYVSEEFNCGAGLFGVSCGTVKNLTVTNATVTVSEESSLAIAAVVGYNMGVVDNVTLSGECTVTGNNCVGGIVGGNNNQVSNCNVDNATVIVIGNNKFEDRIIQADVAECGGLVIGGGFGGTINNCKATGVVKAEGNEPVGLGGIGGCLEMMDSITNCTANVTIESEKGGHAIGGLCGYAGTHSNPNICLETEGFSTKNYPSIIDNCKVTVKIKAPGSTHVGGLVGTGLYYYGEETAFKITNCSVYGTIDGAVNAGAIAGRAEGSTIENCTSEIIADGIVKTDQVGKTSCMYESADQ